MEPAEVKARYRAIGLTGGELARRAHVQLSTLSRFLTGKTSPVLRTVTRLSEALNEAERQRRDELIERHGLPDMPDCDMVRIGGVLRRVVKPTVARQGEAA